MDRILRQFVKFASINDATPQAQLVGDLFVIPKKVSRHSRFLLFARYVAMLVTIMHLMVPGAGLEPAHSFE